MATIIFYYILIPRFNIFLQGDTLFFNLISQLQLAFSDILYSFQVMQWLDNYTLNIANTYHTWLLQYYWLYPLCCTLHPRDYFLRERERNTCLFFHLLMHSLVDSCMCPDWGSNPQPWCIGDNILTNWATWPGLLNSWLFCNCDLYFLIPSLFLPSSATPHAPHPRRLWQPTVCSLYLWLCFCLVCSFILFFRFHI